MLSGNLCNENATSVQNVSKTKPKTTTTAAAPANNVFKWNENDKPNGATTNQLVTECPVDVDTVDSGPALPQNGYEMATTTLPVIGGNLNKFSGSLPNHLDFDNVCDMKGMFSYCASEGS